MTRDDLAGLLRAKDAAKQVYSGAAQDARTASTSDFTIEQRVVLDLREREALTAACAADSAYDDALKAFLKEWQT